MERVIYLILKQQQDQFKELEERYSVKKYNLKVWELLVVWAFIVGLFVPTMSVAFSYPSSYLVEYTLSGVNKCRVKVNSPLARTGLGFVGAAAGGSGIYLPLLARIIESVNPGDWRDLPPCE